MSTTGSEYVSVEQIFDSLSCRYEDVWGNNHNFIRVIECLIMTLPPKAKVLDVGCGVGRPVSQLLAAAGFEVHGIDLSQGMIDQARRNVKGNCIFTKTDMTEYTPPCSFDAVLSMFSLFEIPFDTVRSMVCKFSQWLKPQGTYLLATTEVEAWHLDVSVYDPEWGFVEDVDTKFMGAPCLNTLVTHAGWHKLVDTIGLKIVSSENYSYEAKLEPPLIENHHYLTTRRGSRHPLLGPYPLPQTYKGPYLVDQEGKRAFTDHVRKHGTLPDPSAQAEIVCMDSSPGQGVIPISQVIMGRLVVGQDEPRQSQSHLDGPILKTTKPHDFSKKYAVVCSRRALEHSIDVAGMVRDMAELVGGAEENLNARILIIQGGPFSKVTELLNKCCVPYNTTGSRQLDHQGFLLKTAVETLRTLGFQNVELSSVREPLYFTGHAGLGAATRQAAEVLSGLWYQKDSARDVMITKLEPELRKIFQKQVTRWKAPDEFLIENEEVVLTARRQ